MSKEYTYDIDKYTIGVDENGEDGIGMTIAIIKNGEINFLGNCYGENARCIDLLIKENKKLNGAIQTYDILLKANTEENKKLKKVIDRASARLEYFLIGNLKYQSSQEEFIKLLNILKEVSE